MTCITAKLTGLVRLKAALSVLTIFVVYWILTVMQYTLRHKILNIFQHFYLDTEGCQIPYVDPFHSAIAYLIVPAEGRLCGEASAITYQDRDWLRLNKSMVAARYNSSISHCQYWPVLRVKDDDQTYTFGPSRGVFFEDVRPQDEFIKVSCYNQSNAEIYINIHAFLRIKNHTEAAREQFFRNHLAQSKTEDKLSVLLVGLDSVSRGNSVRHLPKTRSYLQKHFETFEMVGYNKIGDNTFPNIVALMSGKYSSELPYPSQDGGGYFDTYNFIWKEFSARGYRTLFAEEYPNWGTFHYLKKGFRSPPTDYYAVGVLGSLELAGPQFDVKKFCVGDRLRTTVVLDYGLQFSKLFQNKPYFGFVYNTKLTHDDINYVGFADEPHLNFFKSLKKDNLLNNTVLIFFSDHGIRWGPLRRTFVGELEASLPLMFLAFPKWFLEKYPLIKNNLEINTHRLTTPFDMYETLRDILYFNGDVQKNVSTASRSISLFQEVPSNRTCLQADIAVNWCACKNTVPSDIHDKRAQSAATCLVDHINHYLEPVRNICAHLELNRVDKAYLVEGYDQTESELGNFVVLQIRVETTPGNGLFEASVRHDVLQGSFSILGQDAITRTNTYGEQSQCVQDHNFLEYCFCV